MIPRSAPRRPGRVPVLRQMSTAECGAACLAMVLGAHGRHVRVADLRDRLAIGRDGANAVELIDVGRELGLDVRAVRVELDALGELALPAIVHWRFSHYVVLERWDGHRAVVVDPAGGRRSVDREGMSRGFTGVALELAPTERFERVPARRVVEAVRFARSLLGSSRSLVAAALGASLLVQLLTLTPAVATKFAVDTVMGHRQPGLLPALALGVVLLVVTQGVAAYTRASLLNHLRARLDEAVMTRFFRHLLALPFRYFQVRNSGDLLLRLSSNATLREMMTGQTLSLAVDGTFVLVYLVLLAVLAPLYAVVVLALGLLLGLVVFGTFRAMRELTEQEITSQADAQNLAVEILNSVESVKAAGAEREVYERWARRFDVQLQSSLRSHRLEAVQDGLLTTLRIAAPLVLLWVGAWQVLGGTLSIGSALALNALAGSVLVPMGTLANGTRQLQVVGTHLDRIRDVLEERAEQEATETRPPRRLRGEIALRGVGLRYTRRGPWAVRDVDLTVAAGAKVALVGRTGSGKSTLARLLLGLHEPTEGEVRFDGTPLDQLDHRELRRQCGVVGQESALFALSIRENVTLGRPGLGLGEVHGAVARAQLLDDVTAMPLGLDTVLSDGGGGISGGQRQRLALARALVADPAVLVLDEATSHLDVVTEARVERSLAELSCTRVVVAHRLSTVRDADLIVVLQDGAVVETGTHDELVAHAGHYAELVAGQMEVGT